MTCEIIFVYFEFAAVQTRLYSPITLSAPVHTGSDDDVYLAESDYSFPTVPLEPYVGVWTAEGSHTALIDSYMIWCPDAYWCYGPYYMGTDGYTIGGTAQQATVCTSGGSAIDAAAVAFLSAWPSEPWESATSPRF